MSAKKKTEEQQPKPYVSVRCEYGKTHGNYLGHYDRLRASCGKIYWVIQPHRDGPFELRLWPGENLTRHQMEENE